jgi:hypothetical protein
VKTAVDRCGSPGKIKGCKQEYYFWFGSVFIKKITKLNFIKKLKRVQIDWFWFGFLE